MQELFLTNSYFIVLVIYSFFSMNIISSFLFYNIYGLFLEILFLNLSLSGSFHSVSTWISSQRALMHYLKWHLHPSNFQHPVLLFQGIFHHLKLACLLICLFLYYSVNCESRDLALLIYLYYLEHCLSYSRS